VNPPDPDLAAVLAAQGIELPSDQIALLQKYCQVLWDWNTRINLTRHTDYAKFVGRDLVDSRAIAQFLQAGEKVLDVGSGGGVPGVVLAILRPDLSIVLSESVGKKARVLDDIVAQLGLRATVHHGRAEEVVARQRFDTLVVRAVTRLGKLLQWFAPHWNHIGRLLVLKGPSWVEERGEARHFGLMKNLALRKLAVYPFYGSDAESVLLQISPEEKTPKTA
jgi:16S rRNA (guanine527-N7)-methyltransferase